MRTSLLVLAAALVVFVVQEASADTARPLCGPDALELSDWLHGWGHGPIQCESPITVRVLYATPTDRPFRDDYMLAIRRTMLHMRAWYAQQLGGRTFDIAGELPQHCPLPREHDWYAADAWQRLEEDLQACGRVGLVHDPAWEVRPVPGHVDTVWLIFPDVVESWCAVGGGYNWTLGRGGRGLAMAHGLDLLDLVTPAYIINCDYRGWHNDGGGIAHELGHAFGLPHPPGWDEGLLIPEDKALMAGGWWLWPETYLLDYEKARLLGSRFVR